MPPSALEKLQLRQMGQHQYLTAAGAAGAVATCVVSFQGDSRDSVPTRLLSCGLMCLEPLIILGQDRKLYFTLNIAVGKCQVLQFQGHAERPACDLTCVGPGRTAGWQSQLQVWPS